MSDLPKGWIKCQLGDVVEYGKTNKVEPINIPENGWMLELEDIEKDTSKLLKRLSFSERLSKSTKNYFKKGDVLYGKLRPYLNKVIIADQDGFCTTEIVPINPNSIVDGWYLFYWFKYSEFLKYVESVSHGIQMPRLGTEAGLKAPFRLAPLAEQKRIVTKLDSLFAHTRRARQELDHIPKLIERYKQAILSAAFRGDLTADWREKNPEISLHQNFLERIKQKKEYVKLFPIPNQWRWVEWEDVLRLEDRSFKRGPFGSALTKKIFVSKGYKVYEQYCPINDDCSFSRYYITQEKFKELESFSVKAGDFLISCSGVTLGRITQVPEKHEEGIINQALLRVRINNEIIDDLFFMTLFRSPYFQQQIFSNSSGTAIPNVKGVKELKAIPVALPPLLEQKEIVKRVEKYFQAINRLEQEYQKAMKFLDRLEQSTLAKAFRGEIVPQDPNDEPASILLERIQKERENQQTPKKRQLSLFKEK